MSRLKRISRISVVRAESLEEAKQKLALQNRREPQPYPGGQKFRGPRRKNHNGLKSGKLTIIGCDETSDSSFFRWIAICECGNYVGLPLTTFRRKKCCGCSDFYRASQAHSTHGGTNTVEFEVWYSMKRRCSDPRVRGYKNYGARGICVCKRWERFENFIFDMGLRPSPQHSLERIDNNGNYEPGNVRWATRVEQARNKRTNHVLSFNGETMCASAWAERIGVKPKTLLERLRKGMPVERALKTIVK